MTNLAGVATWTPQPPWGTGLSANWPDITLPLIHADLNHMYDSGTIPFLHAMFKPETTEHRQIAQDIRNGDYNVAIDAWLRDVKTYTDTGRKCVIVPYPEFNGTWVNYGADRNNFDPQAAIDIYRYFVTRGRMLSLTSDKVLWCWAPNDVGMGRLSQYWPGGHFVDIVGGSAYCWGGLGRGEPWETPAQVIDPYVAEVRKFTDKPIIITQTGSGEGDSRTPGWLDQLVEYTKTGKIEGFIWFSISEFTYQPGPADFAQRVSSLTTTRPDHWFQEDTMTILHPDAIRKVPCNGTRPGKPWSGGSGKPKLLLHTIEGADADIGWPRDWTRWCSTPHLAMHPWKYGRGEPGALFQLVPFARAAYALRDNDGEDDRYVYQVEMAGRAVNVPTYDDDWYRGVAQLCQWFIDNMGVADIFHDFENPYRMGSDAMNAFSGILGHVHFGRGIDTHTDPGRLDVARLRTFMAGDIPGDTPGGEYQMRTLKYGDGTRSKPDAAVAGAQRAMTVKGHPDRNTIDSRCGADGISRSGTRAQTKSFQQASGIPVTGVIDDATRIEIDRL